MASTSDFRTGMVLMIDGEYYSIVEFQHVKVGRGGAFVRTKLKNFKTDRVVEKTFRGGEKVDEARVERHKMQYLYQEADSLVLMDQETFDQLHVPVEMIGDNLAFLKEGEIIDVLMHGEIPLGVEIPTFVILQVTSTEPGVKGDTVSGATKKAVVETGGEIQVPLFLEEGTMVKVDTRTGEYIERVK